MRTFKEYYFISMVVLYAALLSCLLIPPLQESISKLIAWCTTWSSTTNQYIQSIITGGMTVFAGWLAFVSTTDSNQTKKLEIGLNTTKELLSNIEVISAAIRNVSAAMDVFYMFNIPDYGSIHDALRNLAKSRNVTVITLMDSTFKAAKSANIIISNTISKCTAVDLTQTVRLSHSLAYHASMWDSVEKATESCQNFAAEFLSETVGPNLFIPSYAERLTQQIMLACDEIDSISDKLLKNRNTISSHFLNP